MIRTILILLLFLSSYTMYGRDLYSRQSGNWISGTTWSTTFSGPPCNCIPQGGDRVEITAGHNVSLNSTINIGGAPLSILVFGTWTFNAGRITVPTTSVVYIKRPLGRLVTTNVNDQMIIGATIVWNSARGTLGPGVVLSDTPLPVSLLDFTYSAANDKVALQWATAQEKDNSHFEIRRSFDGISFTAIASVPGSGNTASVMKYCAEDKAFPGKIVYYQLRQYDIDGSYEDLSILAVSNAGQQEEISLYPNPVGGGEELLVQLGADGDKCSLSLRDAQGNEISARLNVTKLNGGNYTINGFSGLHPGVYFVTAIGGAEVTHTKLLVR